MKLVIQIPCYNEAATLPLVLAALPRSLAGVAELCVLVIDDGSSDGTAEVARLYGAMVVRHAGNRGLAQAFATGLETALELGADVIVNTDGDNQYPGAALERLIAPIIAGEADLVIGNRETASDPQVPYHKRRFYDVGNFVVRTVTGVAVHDAPSGFRAMSRAFALTVYLTNPFSYTLETIFVAAEQRMPIREISIRSNEKTRESRLFTGLGQYIARSASIILQGYSQHRPLRAFGWVSLPFLLLGLAIGLRFLYYFVQDPGHSGHVQSLILGAISTVVGVQILIFGMLGALVRANRLLLQDIRLRVRRLELRESRALELRSQDTTAQVLARAHEEG